MKDLDERLAGLTAEQRALLEARLKSKGLQAPRARVIRPLPGRESFEHFPTSLDQERLWFIDQMEPGNPAYNIHTSTRLVGPMDPELMRQAINASIARHEILRTTFRVVDGRPVQVVAPRLEIDLPVIDLQGTPPEELDAATQRVAEETASVRFDLERGPLVRVALARRGPEDHVLMICMQHAITDRWSFDVFEGEISEMYMALREGRSVERSPLPIQFADFAAWQREELSGERLEGHLDYWRKKLSGAPRVLEIPTDRPRPSVQTFNGARAYLIYPESLLDALKRITLRAGATMFMTTLAALDILCWKYTGQRDLIIGSAIADRNRPETENVLGYFLNMLLLRGTIDPSMTFSGLLAQVRETALGAYAHQDVPFATLVSELKPSQDPSRNPLIQVSYIYLDFPVLDSPERAGFTASSLDVDNGASRFDMTLACTDLPGIGLHSYIEYNTDLYDQPKVERMLRHLGRILEWAAEDPDRPLATLDILSDEERRRLVVEFNDRNRPYESACLHELVEQAAAGRPGEAALVFEGTVTTFGELNGNADRIARGLRARGIGPGSLVPLCASRSPVQAAALLGILKAGAAYVPLDPSLPAERLARILGEVRPGIILAERALVAAVPSGGTGVAAIESLLEEDGAGAEPPGARRAGLDDLAYVMFTSGSTGVPKGVMVPHRAIVNRLLWSQDRYPIAPGERVLHNASFAFDIAAWELFGPLLAGATVVLPAEGEHKDPQELVKLLREARVNVAHFVPSMLRLCLDGLAEAGTGDLRLVMCGGEKLDRDLHDRFLRALPSVRLAHFYGPTEAAISCMVWDCAAGLPEGSVPLGHPISNMRVLLLDAEGWPVPAGVPGEIAIGGAGLARGYLGRPDLTAERFVSDPVSGVPGARLYRTGDLARFREDGALDFIGRADHQIKLRGHRIEPAEIESVLAELPGVREAVVVARGEGASQRLVAYLACEPDPRPSEAEMRDAIRRELPAYMIPAAFVLLDDLPLGANGKIDRSVLPDPEAPAPDSEPVEPRTASEKAIAAIWSDLLKRKDFGVETSFFDLGGDSLLATQVVARVRSTFRIDLPLRRFFEATTVAELAGVVEEILVDKLAAMSEEEASGLLDSGPRSLEVR